MQPAMTSLHKWGIPTLFTVLIVSSQIAAHTDDLKVHKRSTSKEDTYDVIHPYLTHSDGSFLSHDINYPHSVHRKKRDLSENVHHKPDNLFLMVKVDGQKRILNLTLNENLLSHGFVVERIRLKQPDKSDINMDKIGNIASSLKDKKHPSCHFRGFVVGQPDSSVAMSTCHGLNGLIRTRSGEYFIEPMDKLVRQPIMTSPRPHKIYKRDTSNFEGKFKASRKVRYEEKLDTDYDDFDDENFCGVADTRSKYNKIMRNRQQWEIFRKRRELLRSRRLHGSAHRRGKRSVSTERWIETLVVVDKKMVDHYSGYEDGYLETYVLTIINMVAEIFHDASIGNSLHVTLVRLMLLDGEEKDLSISQHAEKTLDSFCKWVKKVNPKDDSHPQHHDVAVLLTRHDICSNYNHSCETLGLAHVAGMCQWHRSCNVNQDTGLSLAYTVAHEIGHNFAMHHDGQSNECTPNGKHPTVMAPHLTSNNKAIKWSSCSQQYITRFLDRNWGFCLSDKPPPNENFAAPMELPGKIYDADHQCRLMFGEKSRHCYGIDDICNRLWCSSRGSCKSRLHSAVAGTACGDGKWCYNGKCVSRIKRPHPVHGAWSDWSTWNKCSRTCGIGISVSTRECNNPAPRHNGNFCLGERKRYKTCNKWKCPPNQATFREIQCSRFNNIKYKGKLYQWIPVESHTYPCELHCYATTDNSPVADRLHNQVIDGTPCYPDRDDICVDGICRRLACDKNIGSNATEDKCGVCHGNGQMCKDVDKTFNERIGEEYVEIGILPAGARNIDIMEHKGANNFLALRNPKNESDFYLNGNYMIQWDTQFELANTWFKYERINATTDHITAKGPITHDVVVMLLFVEENKGVNITYTVPKNNSIVIEEEEPPVFNWKLKEWSRCSTTCGKGVQIAVAACFEETSGEVDEDFCNSTTRPDDMHKSCNEDFACPAEWWVGDWQPCPITCGPNVGIQHRTVICIQSVEMKEQMVVNETLCSHTEKPVKQKECTEEKKTVCPYWRTTDWGVCSVSCGGGNSNRTIQCGYYITTDVIDIGDDTMDLIPRKSPKDSRKKSRHRTTHKPRKDDNNEEVQEIKADDSVEQDEEIITEDKDAENAEVEHPKDKDPELDEENNFKYEVVLLAKGMVVETNLHKEGTEFIVRSNEECDPELKPSQWKPCNEFDCLQPTNYVQETTNYEELPTEAEYETTNIVDYDLYATDSDEDLEESTNQTFGDVNEDVKPGDEEKFDIEEDENLDDDDKDSNLIEPTLKDVISSNVEKDKPYFDIKTKEKVEYHWVTGIWTECSTTCGVGAKVRKVECSSGNNTDCDLSNRPAPAQICEIKPCTKWVYGEWSECSRNCGDGFRKKEGLCVDERSGEELRPYHCGYLDPLPALNISCNLHRCMPWKTSRWTVCNATCGAGQQRRRTACSREGRCDPLLKPEVVKSCMMKKCVEWKTTEWKACSVNCGGGIQKRTAHCIERKTGLDANSSLCHPDLRPVEVRKCNEVQCRAADYDFASCKSDRLSSHFCVLLKQWGKCVQPSVAIQCCTTCKTYLNIRGKDKIS